MEHEGALQQWVQFGCKMWTLLTMKPFGVTSMNHSAFRCGSVGFSSILMLCFRNVFLC